MLSQHLLPSLAPAFVQIGFWIQVKPLYFLVFRFHLIRFGALPQPIKICWVLYLQRMTSWQPHMIKMKHLRVTAPDVTLSTSGGVSFHTDTNDDYQLITNTLILGSSFPWDKWTICHLPNASGKPRYFFLHFPYSMKYFPYFPDPLVCTNSVQDGKDAFSQAIYTSILETVARQRTVVYRIHFLFPWPFPGHLWHLCSRTPNLYCECSCSHWTLSLDKQFLNFVSYVSLNTLQ